MTQVLVSDSPAQTSRLQLVPAPCALCGLDEGEPVAVGNDFDHRVTADSFLVLACPACGLLYLNPRPAPEEWHRLYPAGYFASSRPCTNRIEASAIRRLLRACGRMPPDARVLEVAYGPTLHLETVRRTAPRSWLLEAVTPHEDLTRSARASGFVAHHGWPLSLIESGGAYDLVILIHALEHCDAPVEELRSIRRGLRPGGRVVIVSLNAASASWRVFRGRHWAGYDFPRHRCLFGPHQLARLAAEAGLALDRLYSPGDRRVWPQSAENLARDWGAPAWLRGTARMAFTAVGSFEVLASRAASFRAATRLEAILRKPVEKRG
jgi:Methyltransferase domain